jgi:hypothetical protein
MTKRKEPTMGSSGTAHISLDDQGRAWIDDTNTKVIEVVHDQIGFKRPPSRCTKTLPISCGPRSTRHCPLIRTAGPKFDAEVERQDRTYQEMSADPTGRAARQELLERRRARVRCGDDPVFTEVTIAGP